MHSGNVESATMVVIGTNRDELAGRWRDALDSSFQTGTVANFDLLRQWLAARPAGLLLLHHRLPGLHGRDGVVQLHKAHPNLRIILFSDRPGDDEGLTFLMAGIRGYCNTYMAQPLLAQAVRTVLDGEVWVGWSLMQRLIRAVGAGAVPGAGGNGLEGLTARELDTARLVAGGASNKVIASELGITERTVKAHLGSIFQKTGTKDRLQLALLVNGQPGRTVH